MYIKVVTDYLDCAEKQFSDKVGFVDSMGSTTYKEFRNNALKIATTIIDKHIEKRPIAIYLDKSTFCLSTAFGVVYSGNYYTFLDTQMPLARVQKICDVLKPAMIITDKKHCEEISQIDVEIINIEKCHGAEINYKAIGEIRARVIDTDVVYVLFTSGSTGNPKGVIISHRNVITYMNWSKEAFGFSHKDVWGSQTPFYFSMSVLDIFQTVCSAATLVIIPKRLFSFPVELLKFLEDHNVNTIYWVPSALCQVANMGVLPIKHVNSLEKILFAGEVMPTKQLNMWRREYPDKMFANLFGPTEVTDICTYYILDRELEDSEPVPIGKQCDNMNVFIIDKDGKEVIDLEIGEMYVRGASVAYGYYNQPDKTKEMFVQNPLQSAYEEKVYKTGDLVHYNERGEIIYVSRKDFQIKHMGYRIELGEIENIVSAMEEVQRVCCLYDQQKSHIILFYMGNIDKRELKTFIKTKLPKYMVPNEYVQVKEMPLNLNGKIDRNVLLSMVKNI